MNALEQLNLAAPIVSTYTEIEELILCHIAEQLAANPDTMINATSEWRIKMLAQMGRINRDTARIIASKTGKIPDEVRQVVQSSIDKVLNEYGLEMNGKIEESTAAALKNYDLQAVKDKYNQVNTVMQYKAKQAYVNGINSAADKLLKKKQKALENSQEYLDILGKNAMAAVLGEKSRTEAIRETIAEMSKKGIPAFVDKNGREWSPEAYVDMDIRNTAKNAALAAEFASLDELGQDVILVSSHSGSRPLCAPYQGKLYSRSGKSGTITDAKGKSYTYTPLFGTSFGEPAGLFGINCGHRMRGVSDGTFINREKEFDREKTNEEYRKVQRQRAMEREVRKKKTEANMYEAAGDTDAARDLRRLAADEDKKLRDYCGKEGLYYRRDRTEVYGFKKVDNFEKGGIINKKKSEWDNDLPPRGQITEHIGEDYIYSYVANELRIDENTATTLTDSIMAFTDDYYTDIREFQRGGHIADENYIKSLSDNIEDYIKKAPRWNGGETFRGCTVSDDEFLLYKQGFINEMGGTSSWSNVESISKDFANQNVTNERPNKIIFHCDTQSKGTGIKHISVFEEEYEVICSKESHYEVLKIEVDDDNVNHVYLKEV